MIGSAAIAAAGIAPAIGTVITRMTSRLRRGSPDGTQPARDDLTAVADSLRQPAPPPGPDRAPAPPRLTVADLEYLGRLAVKAVFSSPMVREGGQEMADALRGMGIAVSDPELGRVVLHVLATGAEIGKACQRAYVGPGQAMRTWLDVLAAAALDLTELERQPAPPPGG